MGIQKTSEIPKIKKTFQSLLDLSKDHEKRIRALEAKVLLEK